MANATNGLLSLVDYLNRNQLSSVSQVLQFINRSTNSDAVKLFDPKELLFGSIRRRGFREIPPCLQTAFLTWLLHQNRLSHFKRLLSLRISDVDSLHRLVDHKGLRPTLSVFETAAHLYPLDKDLLLLILMYIHVDSWFVLSCFDFKRGVELFWYLISVEGLDPVVPFTLVSMHNKNKKISLSPQADGSGRMFDAEDMFKRLVLRRDLSFQQRRAWISIFRDSFCSPMAELADGSWISWMHDSGLKQSEQAKFLEWCFDSMTSDSKKVGRPGFKCSTERHRHDHDTLDIRSSITGILADLHEASQEALYSQSGDLRSRDHPDMMQLHPRIQLLEDELLTLLYEHPYAVHSEWNNDFGHVLANCSPVVVFTLARLGADSGFAGQKQECENLMLSTRRPKDHMQRSQWCSYPLQMEERWAMIQLLADEYGHGASEDWFHRIMTFCETEYVPFWLNWTTFRRREFGGKFPRKCDTAMTDRLAVHGSKYFNWFRMEGFPEPQFIDVIASPPFPTKVQLIQELDQMWPGALTKHAHKHNLLFAAISHRDVATAEFLFKERGFRGVDIAAVTQVLAWDNLNPTESRFQMESHFQMLRWFFHTFKKSIATAYSSVKIGRHWDNYMNKNFQLFLVEDTFNEVGVGDVNDYEVYRKTCEWVHENCRIIRDLAQFRRKLIAKTEKEECPGLYDDQKLQELGSLPNSFI